LREAKYEAIPDRVAPDHENDRHRRGCGLGRQGSRGIADDQGNLPAKKVRDQKRQPVSLIFRRAVLDGDVLALDKACFLQALVERSHAVHRHVSERSTEEKQQRKAGGISARPRQTIDEAAADWIDDGCEHDRHGAGCVLRRRQGRVGSGQDDVWRDRDQFRGRTTNLVGIARTSAGNDPHIAPVGPAQLLQPLLKCRAAGLRFRIVRREIDEQADPPHPLALLSACSQRPDGRRAAEQHDKLTPLHVWMAPAWQEKM
jgi:hypothetical protein